MSFKISHGNVNMFAPDAKREDAIRKIVGKGDIFTLNEAQKDHAFLAPLAGEFFAWGENVVGWKSQLFEKVDTFSRLVMQGGVHNGKRRGPSRGVAGVVLIEKATGLKFGIATHHAIAKWQTTNPERKPLALEGFANVGAAIADAITEHELDYFLITGDVNAKGEVHFPGPDEVEIATPATFKNLRYDRVFAVGDTKVTGVKEFVLDPKDHNGLVATVTLGVKVPVPTPPKPKPPVDSAEKITATAKKYVGYHEGRSGGHWNNDNQFAKKMGWANHQAWCATFVCSVFDEAGLIHLIKTPSAGVDQLAAGFKKAGRWSEYPAEGAVIFFGTPSDLTHTGVSTHYDEVRVYTIEGNTNTSGSREGDGVYLKVHQRREARIVGYGYPDYTEGVRSADPQWSRSKPKPKPKPQSKTAHVADYSFDHPNPKALKDAGFTAVMRYISNGSKKDLTHSEAHELHVAGLGIGLVFESTAGRAGEGADAGREDVKAAEDAANKLGYPKTLPIFFAVDSDLTAEKVTPYFNAIKKDCTRPVGSYGGFKIADAGLTRWIWQTAAWSGGRVSDKAHLFQKVKTTLKVKGSPSGWDENDLLKPIPFWEH